MSDRQTFGPRLRRERERRGITLDTIAAVTKVSAELWDGLERNDFSRWPSGIFARAFVRDYARAVGLDADEVVDEFCRLFPHGDRRAEPVIRDIAAIVASQSGFEYDYRYTSEADRRTPPLHVVPKQTPTKSAFAAMKGFASSLSSSVTAMWRNRADTTRSATR
jgi:transcriptional regulator with XRE-family HTH domain